MKLRIKYFEGATHLEKIAKGNWIDVYARKDVFIQLKEKGMIPLGFALELPTGWEGHLAPRSSTFKTWGVIQTNSIGIVDDTYIGDNDEWMMPVYCLKSYGTEYTIEKVKELLGGFDENTTTEEYETYIKYTKKIITQPFNKVSEKVVINRKGTWIHEGDKIGQFRIMEVMPELEFEEVESFGNEDRGGFGTTGTK